MRTRQVPTEIAKIIIESANVEQMGCREIAKELQEKCEYEISYRTVARVIKEDREEKAEQLKSLKLEECMKSLPRDLEILDEIINDLYEIFKRTEDINIKVKVSKEIRGTIETKLSNFTEKNKKSKVIFAGRNIWMRMSVMSIYIKYIIFFLFSNIKYVKAAVPIAGVAALFFFVRRHI